MIGTIDIKVNAAHPNMPLLPIYAFVGSPSQVRIINVPKAIGKWAVTSVQITANYPDNTSRSVTATLVGGCWSATLPASASVGQSLMGFKVTASGTDEAGAAVTGYVLGKGDVFILNDDSTITIGETTYYVHLVDSQPTAPKKGDLCKIDGTWKMYNGTAWEAFGGGSGDVKHSEFSDMTADLDPDESSIGEVMTKVNTLISKLKGTTAMILAILAFSAFAAVDVQTAKLSTLPGKTMVVTNVVGAAAISDLALKQDKLPYATNAIPAGVISSAPWIRSTFTPPSGTDKSASWDGVSAGVYGLKINGGLWATEGLFVDSWDKFRNNNISSDEQSKLPYYLAHGTWNTATDRFVKQSDITSLRAVTYAADAPESHKTASGILSTAENTAGTIATNVVAEADTTYAAYAQITNMNQSVQSVSVASGGSLTILAPTASVKDWIVYANCAADNTALVLPAGQYYASDTAYTNALKAGVTALYFTSCGNGIVISRQELKPITVQ